MLKNSRPALVGLSQALGVALYVGLVVIIISNLERLAEPPDIIGIFLMLLLLVFSVAITGSLIFGYPVYLSLHHQTQRAIKILVFTLLYLLLLILGVVFIVGLFVN